MKNYFKPQITLREALAKENIGNNIILDLTSFAQDYFEGEDEQED